MGLLWVDYAAVCDEVSTMCADYFGSREWDWKAFCVDREANVFRVDFSDQQTLQSVADKGTRFWKGQRFYVIAWSEEYGTIELSRMMKVWVGMNEVPSHVWDKYYLVFMAEKFRRVERKSLTVAHRWDLLRSLRISRNSYDWRLWNQTSRGAMNTRCKS